MKKQTSLFFVMACMLVIGCRHHGNTSISFTETKHFYSMEAWFNKSMTSDIEHYMDKRIGSESNMSFVNTRIDGRLSLEDQSTIYIKKYPGYLRIKLDKDENSGDSYERIRDMCEGIKRLLAK